MKKLTFLPILFIAISISLFSCSSAEKRSTEKAEAVNMLDAAAVANANAQEHMMLQKISNTTNPNVLYAIYYDVPDEEVSNVAYTKLESILRGQGYDFVAIDSLYSRTMDSE